MLVTRRDFLSQATTLAVGVAVVGLAGTREAFATLPAGIGKRPDFSGPLPQLSLGTQPPLTDEEKMARRVIMDAPDGPTPYGIAEYFLRVAKGEFGIERKPYAAGWPERWNPVIVEFFRATGTVPAGDTTSWCAAFVNWCFARARTAPATGSASSGSFRCFGMETASPEEGDIVVFRRANSNDACIGKGHVGFFVRQSGSRILVLGGNQIDGQNGSHRVSSKWLRKEGSILKFHSYRTDQRLHPI